MKKMLLIVFALLILSGCAADKYLNETESVDTTAAFQLTDRKVVEEIDLGWLLLRYAPNVPDEGNICEKYARNVPDFARGALSGIQSNGAGNTQSAESRKVDGDKARLDRALAYFNCRIEKANESQRAIARNALQERLLAASRQRCGAFNANLQRAFSRTNFGLGVATTIAGTAGALVSSATAAHNWSGAAAIFSGTRSEFNQDFMANLAAHVIVDGIEKRRQIVYEQIQQKGQSKRYDNYPVEAAIKDAFFYHGECSVVAGFQQASDAIKYVNDPGLAASIQTLAKLRAANFLMTSSDVKPEDALAAANKISGMVPLIAGSALGEKKENNGYLGQYWLAVQQISEAEGQMKADIAALIKRAKENRGQLTSEKLSLKKEADLQTPTQANGFDTQCRQKIDGYFSSERLAAAKGGLETDVAQKNKLLASEASIQSQGQFLADQVSILSGNYVAKTEKLRKEWATLAAKAADGDAAENAKAISDLNELLKQSSLPTLDTTLLNKVTTLCQ